MKKFFNANAIIVALWFVACGHPIDIANTADDQIPLNEATAEETAIIDTVKQDIIQIAASYGVLLDLDRLPIVVSSKQDIPNADGSNGYQGLCILDQIGNGTAILLSKQMLKLDLYKAEKYKRNEVALDTFKTLLHEVGHCYFGRKHESEVLEIEKYQLTIREKNETYNLPFLPASVMDNSAGTVIPYSLKRYYVAEIVGFYRAKSLQEVAQFVNATVTLVKE